MLCKRCAAPLQDGEKICIHCGANQENIPAEIPSDTDGKRELTFLDCLITFLVGSVPIIGCIMLLIWSCGTEKIKGRAQVARAYLLFSVFVFLVIAVCVIYLSYVALVNSELL